MARRADLIGLLAQLVGCDDAQPPLRLPIPDAAPLDANRPNDASIVDAAPDAASPTVQVEDAPILACGALTITVPLVVSAPVEVTPILGDQPLTTRLARPGAPLVLDLPRLADGAYPLSIEVGGERLTGPIITVDRTPPVVEWPDVDEACVDTPPDPRFDEPVEWSRDVGRLGCRVIHRVEAIDACALRTVARRAWRVGPPGQPTVSGDVAFTWTLAPDGCSDTATATLNRVGEPPAPYVAETLVEWPGEYALTLQVSGCNGPAEWAFTRTVPPGRCDRAPPPLDTAPRVRGWLEFMAATLFDLSVALSADDAALGATVREAATVLAGHPGFPGACPRPPCSTRVERARALAALELAADALADQPSGRAARRCIAEAARAVVAARRYGDEACPPAEQAQSEALVDAWITDDAARTRINCLCGGCPPTDRCVDAPELRADADPVAFAAQLAALGGPAATACARGACAALVMATDAALEAEACEARTLLSVSKALIGRRCAGAGRFRHPGLLALDAALARWPVWSERGTAESRADLASAAALCAP